jgi:hypothetical protein
MAAAKPAVVLCCILEQMEAIQWRSQRGVRGVLEPPIMLEKMFDQKKILAIVYVFIHTTFYLLLVDCHEASSA